MKTYIFQNAFSFNFVNQILTENSLCHSHREPPPLPPLPPPTEHQEPEALKSPSKTADIIRFFNSQSDGDTVHLAREISLHDYESHLAAKQDYFRGNNNFSIFKL